MKHGFQVRGWLHVLQQQGKARIFVGEQGGVPGRHREHSSLI
jgi:hypothetical protein